jgi:hypothetical protein
LAVNDGLVGDGHGECHTVWVHRTTWIFLIPLNIQGRAPASQFLISVENDLAHLRAVTGLEW